MLTPAALRAAAAPLPRARLAYLPTPLEDAPRFADWVGGGVRVFVKRDDCTGLFLGGNKARHNEFLLGDAVDQGCDVVVWGAGVQSNNCRQTAASCAKLGIECQLILSRAHYSTEVQGNLLLDHLAGASVEFTDAELGPQLDAVLAARADELRRAGRKPYVWHRPRVVPRAAVSYALAVSEIVEQLDAMGVTPAGLYVSSAGATGAGVALGAKLFGWPGRVRLIAPMHWPWSIPAAFAADANAAAELLGLPDRMTEAEIDADETLVAPGYGMPSRAGQEALHALARTEAVLLDPVYSAKAMAGLVRDARAGMYPPGAALVFLHTGGVPAIFADPAAALGIGG